MDHVLLDCFYIYIYICTTIVYKVIGCDTTGLRYGVEIEESTAAGWSTSIDDGSMDAGIDREPKAADGYHHTELVRKEVQQRTYVIYEYI
jgi:hypothetical protein